jgi:LPXTG-motif cell wall-anchored protein
MLYRLSVIAAAVCTCIAFTAPATRAATLTGSPNPVTVGANVTLDLSEAYDDLIALTTFYSYDASMLSFVSSASNPNWVADGGSADVGFDDGLGSGDLLTFLSTSVGSGVSGTNMASYVFTALAPGTTIFSLSGNWEDEATLTPHEFSLDFTVTILGDTTAVPLPAAAALFPAGLAGLGLLLFRRRRKQDA